jgi:hypothetical protein
MRLMRHPIDPAIPPEREIAKANNALLDTIRGTNRILRSGEQFFMSCVCGALKVTSDTKAPSEFEKKHTHN